MIVAIIVLVILLIIPAGYIISQYNGLVALRNHIKESWADIDTELKRRYDLIPNLVETVKGYAAHEQATLQSVIELRNQAAANNGTVAEQSSSERALVAGMQKLMAVVEAYPDLKASENFLELQRELTNTEDRIQASRRFYNANVRDYTIKRETFPSNLVASMFNFQPADYFEVDEAVRENPKVEL
ncbi:MAG: LemA family protein [Verrucomicrobiota bacterium]